METRHAANQSENDLRQFRELAELFEADPTPLVERIEAFPKYVSRQSLAKFLTKWELMRLILGVSGSIIECGVLHGAGLLAWAKLSSIAEPANHTRRVIGFDTFAGFASVSEHDANSTYQDIREGAMHGSPLSHVQRAIAVYDMNRPIAHIPKVELVVGDIVQTAPQYVLDNTHLVVSLLYLDADLYSPTAAALEAFVPRMPRGAILAFDQLNAPIFRGETVAANAVVGLKNLQLQRFPFDPYVSYAIL